MLEESEKKIPEICKRVLKGVFEKKNAGVGVMKSSSGSS
jgi:hypothetical protein